MSCNGCRVLRKGCSENCVLRQCLQCIDSPQAQGHATIFVAKFFGRAGLMSFISSVPEIQRPALFQSLLFEAVGRAINPVNGAVGLLWTGNWHVCQSAVETVLRGGAIRPLPELVGDDSTLESDIASEGADHSFSQQVCTDSRSNKPLKRKVCDDVAKGQPSDLDLCLVVGLPETMAGGGGCGGGMKHGKEKRRAATPSEESGTTTLGSGSRSTQGQGDEGKLLIFV